MAEEVGKSITAKPTELAAMVPESRPVQETPAEDRRTIFDGTDQHADQ